MNYGEFGGQYVPQRLKEKLNRIKEEFEKTKSDKNFKNEYLYYLNQYVGRPSPFIFCKKFKRLFQRCKNILKKRRSKSYWFS